MQIAVWVQSQSYRAPHEGADQHVSWTGTRSLTGFPLEYSKLSLWGNAGRGGGTAAKNLTQVFAVVGECFTSTSEQIFGASASRQHFFNVTIFCAKMDQGMISSPPVGFILGRGEKVSEAFI